MSKNERMQKILKAAMGMGETVREIGNSKVVSMEKVQNGYLVTCELKQVFVEVTPPESKAMYMARCFEFHSIECMEEKPVHTQPCYDLQLALEFAKRWVKGEISREELMEADIRANAVRSPLSSDPTNTQY